MLKRVLTRTIVMGTLNQKCNVLQSLQGHLSVVQDFIFSLNIFSDFALLISLGINSHNFGARQDILSVSK